MITSLIEQEEDGGTRLWIWCLSEDEKKEIVQFYREVLKVSEMLLVRVCSKQFEVIRVFWFRKLYIYI